MKFLRNAVTVGGFTALSRILGLVREILMATFFGTTLVKSAFDLAFRIPNLFRAIFGEGALSQAFIPIYTQTRTREGNASANAFAGKVLTLLAAILCTITAITLLAIQLARPWMTYGSRPETVLRLLAILFPYLIFLCLAAACMGILNSIGKFALPAATPMLMNLVWIATLVFIIPRMPESPDRRIAALAWAVVFSGLLQLICQAAPLTRRAIRPILSTQWKDPQLKHMFNIFLPAALAMGIRDINTLVDGMLALWIGTWAPAALVFAERLAYLPLGLFATALGTVLLPELSRLAVADPETMHKTLRQAITAILVIMLPAAAALAYLATPIIQLIYEQGAFDANSTRLTSRALMAYAPGLVVFAIYKMLLPAFYARRDSRTPMLCGAAAVALNLCLNIIFIVILPREWRHAGLAAATVLTSTGNTSVLAIILYRQGGLANVKDLGRTALRITCCTLIMLAALALARPYLSDAALINMTTKGGQITHMAILITIGIATYLLALLLIARNEIRALLAKTTAPASPPPPLPAHRDPES